MGKSSPNMGFSIAIFNSRRVTVAFFSCEVRLPESNIPNFVVGYLPNGGNKWEQNMFVAYTLVSFGSVQNFWATPLVALPTIHHTLVHDCC